MRVRDIMTTGVLTVPPRRSCEDAWTVMRQKQIHHVIVTSGGQVVGVLSERDCGGRNGAAIRRERTAGDLMTAPAIVVSPDVTVQRAANMMRGRSIGSLVVVSGGRVVGIVTVSDLLEMVGRGSGTRRASDARPALHHRVPHRKQTRANGVW